MTVIAATGRRQPVRLYLASFLVVGLSVSVLGPALSELRDRAGTDIGGIGVLFVGQSLGYLPGSVLAGRLYDRFDGHRIFAGAMVVLACGLALVPAVASLPALFAVFGVIGAGAAAADVGANALIMWELGSEVGRSMSLLHLCFGLGALSAPLVVHVGLDLATRGAAIAAFAVAWWALSVPAPPAPGRAEGDHAETSSGLLALIAVFFFVYVGLEVGFGGWIHTYGEEIRFDELAATWLTATFWIGFTAGRLLSSMTGQRIRPKGMLVVACSLTIGASGVLVLGDGRAAPVWVGSALMGLATGPQFPTMLTYLERRIRVTGVATAWFIAAAGLGGLVFPWLIGRWFDSAGTAAFPWSVLLLGWLTFGSFAVTNRVLGG